MPILALLLLAGGIFLGLSVGKKSEGSALGNDSYHEPEPVISGIGLPDVLPINQGGTFKRDYDSEFYRVSQETGVPFALLKAHAIRESNLKPNAIRHEPGTSKRPPSASYGLMQILWWQDSERFSAWGYPDQELDGGERLFNVYENIYLGAQIILDNYNRLGLRDSINAYNTGVAENKRVAPGNYVNDVLKNYQTLIGKEIEV